MASRARETEVIPVLEHHKIQVLLEAGFSVKDVAARTGASPKVFLKSYRIVYLVRPREIAVLTVFEGHQSFPPDVDEDE